ncbi:LysR family transcriptional regulator [Paraburkholderia steynii]|uniref:LysR family transcriptional regulator n=1 Tax=Paraburkholderia steynii TaxID=1245441 RepID=UPI001424663F
MECFTAVAQKLQISRAAMSKHTSHLKRHVGGHLLRRTSRRLSLTENGAVFYD